MPQWIADHTLHLDELKSEVEALRNLAASARIFGMEELSDSLFRYLGNLSIHIQALEEIAGKHHEDDTRRTLRG